MRKNNKNKLNILILKVKKKNIKFVFHIKKRIFI